VNKKAFKVVIEIEKGLLVSSCIPGASRMVYKPGEWTTKKKYGPFVFDTLEHAQLFYNCEYQQIWECETSDDLQAIRFMVDFADAKHATKEKIQLLMDEVMFWLERCGRYTEKSSSCWLGTMIASSIKLTERIEGTA
jgi:hypothetical protein